MKFLIHFLSFIKIHFLLYYKFVDVRDVDGKNSIDIRVDIEWYFESIECL